MAAKKYVERLSHACGTKRGLQVIQEADGRYTGYCFHCHTYVKNPYSDMDSDYVPPKPKVKSPEEVQKELKIISGLPTEALSAEKIDKWVLEHFGVKVGYDQETASEIRSHYYPYYEGEELKAYQVKVLAHGENPKKFFSVGDFDQCDPFGWRQALKAGGFKLFITEGQKDAMALTQVLKKFGKSDRLPAVISLPNGVKSVDKMSRYVKDFDRWKEVVLCFDMDTPGREAVDNFIKFFPTAKVVNLPLKDAHDMLMEGREMELFQAAVFHAKKKLSDKLKRSSEVWDLAAKRPAMGMSWPWPSFTELTRGIRRGEGTYFGGGVKMGW